MALCNMLLVPMMRNSDERITIITVLTFLSWRKYIDEENPGLWDDKD